LILFVFQKNWLFNRETLDFQEVANVEAKVEKGFKIIVSIKKKF
jgi:hypothetical protein